MTGELLLVSLVISQMQVHSISWLCNYHFHPEIKEFVKIYKSAMDASFQGYSIMYICSYTQLYPGKIVHIKDAQHFNLKPKLLA